MSDKRRGLGRGLGALIPSSAAASGNGSAPSRPVDLFFPEARKRTPAAEVSAAVDPDVAPDAEVAAEPLAPSANTAAGGASDITDRKTAAGAKKAPARKVPASKGAS